MLLAWTLKTNPDQESYEKMQLNVNKPKGVVYYTVQYNLQVWHYTNIPVCLLLTI